MAKAKILMSQASVSSKHIAIIGAGIVGVSTAVWLQRAGHQVTIIDEKGPAGGTSYGNAGVLAASSIVPVTVPAQLSEVVGVVAVASHSPLISASVGVTGLVTSSTTTFWLTEITLPFPSSKVHSSATVGGGTSEELAYVIWLRMESTS